MITSLLLALLFVTSARVSPGGIWLAAPWDSGVRLHDWLVVCQAARGSFPC